MKLWEVIEVPAGVSLFYWESGEEHKTISPYPFWAQVSELTDRWAWVYDLEIGEPQPRVKTPRRTLEKRLREAERD